MFAGFLMGIVCSLMVNGSIWVLVTVLNVTRRTCDVHQMNSRCQIYRPHTSFNKLPTDDNCTKNAVIPLSTTLDVILLLWNYDRLFHPSFADSPEILPSLSSRSCPDVFYRIQPFQPCLSISNHTEKRFDDLKKQKLFW